MKNISLFITACLILIFLTTMVGCHHNKTTPFGPRAFKDRIEKMTEKLSKDLDLTDEQKNHLNIIKDEINAELLKRKNQMAEMFNVIREEIHKDSIDQQRLEQLFDDRKQFREGMHRFMFKKFAEFHAMLTKEQRLKLDELIEEMVNKFIRE